MTDKINKQKIFKLKEGDVLRYKKRYFGSNWQPAHVSIFNNGKFEISNRKSSSLVMMPKNSTLILFDQVNKYMRKFKWPIPPNDYKKENMLAIGLIQYGGRNRLSGITAVFYQFLFNSQSELIEWVIAFYNSVYSESPIQNAKSNLEFNKLVHAILSANQLNISRADSSIFPNSMNNMDDLSLGLLMANTAAFNMNNLGAVGSMAAIGSAGLLAASAQHQLATGDIQSLYNNQRFNSLPSEFFNSNRNRYYGDSGTCLNDDSTAFFIDGDGDAYALQADGGDGNTFGGDDSIPIAEIGSLFLNSGAVDFGGISDFGIDVGASAAGGDCGFDCDFGAIAII